MTCAGSWGSSNDGNCHPICYRLLFTLYQNLQLPWPSLHLIMVKRHGINRNCLRFIKLRLIKLLDLQNWRKVYGKRFYKYNTLYIKCNICTANLFVATNYLFNILYLILVYLSIRRVRNHYIIYKLLPEPKHKIPAKKKYLNIIIISLFFKRFQTFSHI